MASIQINFGGISYMKGNEGPKPEARRADSWEWGLGVKGSQPPPHQLGDVGERCKLPSGVRGRAPKTLKFGAT